MVALDGPRLAPRSGRAPTSLVVLLHGYGADGRDLIDLGDAWGERLPDTAFVSPHAPEPCGEAPVGRQWFPLTRLDPREMARGADGAAPALERFIADELARLALPPQRLALVGFSQGCMMALHVALRAGVPPAAVVGYSGLLLAGGARPADRVAPPVLLVHGTDDAVVPTEALFASAYGLARMEVPVEWHLSPGLGHGIDDPGLAHGGDFLAEFLAGPRR